MYNSNIPQLDNIFRDLPSRNLPDSVLQQGENIIFKDGVIQQRSGLINFASSSLPFDSPVTGLSLYSLLRNLERITVAFTDKDIYRYDKVTGNFILITRNYNTGTATGSGTGNKTITISGGTLDNTEWRHSNLYKISFDSDDIELCTTWHLVASVDSVSQLTLSEDGPAVSGSEYCLRLCYFGDMDDEWIVTYPYDPDTNDRAMLATNGVDYIQKWNGTGQCEDLTAYHSYCQHICSFGSKSYHRILCSSTYDPVSMVHFRQNIDMSDAGTLTWTSGHYYELIDKEFEIKGIVPLRDFIITYTTHSISIGQVNPDPSEPFIFNENIIRNIGTISIRTVVDIGPAHIFWSGKSLYMFDGMQVQDIGRGNSQYIVKNVNNSFQHRSFAAHILEHNLYCLFLPWQDSEYPNMCVVYNYQTRQWMFWQFNDVSNVMMYLTAQGEYIKTYAPTWEEIETAGITWEDWDVRWQDLIVNENFGRLIFGDTNGYLYEYSEDNTTDSGSDIVSTIVTKDYPLNQLSADFRLLETVLQLRLKENSIGFYPADITVRASVDAGRNWSAWQIIPLDGNETYMEKKIHWNVVGKHVRLEIKFSNPLVMEGLRIGFNANYKSMKFDE
jgi:hypothetical protein